MKDTAPRALSGLAEKLEGEQVERALQAALAIEDEDVRARALSGLAEELEGRAGRASAAGGAGRSRMKGPAPVP